MYEQLFKEQKQMKNSKQKTDYKDPNYKINELDIGNNLGYKKDHTNLRLAKLVQGQTYFCKALVKRENIEK